MTRLRLLAISLLMTGALGLQAAPPPIWAHREWEVLPVADDPDGKHQVTATWYAFPERTLALAAEEVFDPAQPNVPPTSRRLIYASVARWGWIPWGFFSPVIVRVAEGERMPVAWGPLRALNLLESQGDARVMADFVWGLLQDDQEIGSLVMRCVLFKDEPTWLYVRLFTVGDPSLEIERINLMSMGGMGRRRPGAELHLAGLTTTAPLPPPQTGLPLGEYWMLAQYPVNAEEMFNTRGCAGVFLPEDLSELVFTASWGGGLSLVPAGAARRTLRFALSDMNGPPQVWVQQLREGAADRRRRLATLDWRPDMQADLAALQRRVTLAAGDLAADTPVLLDWQQRQAALDAAIEAAAEAEIGTPEELAYGFEAQTCRSWLDEHWSEVVSAYIRQTLTPAADG